MKSARWSVTCIFYLLLISNMPSPQRPDTENDTATSEIGSDTSLKSQDPASSPYQEPVSPAVSSFGVPESSPYTDPVSSPLKDDPESSPWKDDPVSSPFKDEEASSPFTDRVVSSPVNEEPSLSATASPSLDIQRTSHVSSFSDNDSRPPESKRVKYDEPVSESSPSHHLLLPIADQTAGRTTTQKGTSTFSENQCVEPTGGSYINTTTIELSSHQADPSPCLPETWTQDHNVGHFNTATVLEVNNSTIPTNTIDPGDASFSEDMNQNVDRGIAKNDRPENWSSCSDSSSGSDLSIESPSDSESSNSSDCPSSHSKTSASVESSNASSVSSSLNSSDSNSDDEEDSDSSDDSSSDDDPLSVRKVFQQSNLSVDEGVLSLMNLFMKRKLEKSLMGDILKVVLQFLPNDHCMPRSQHLLFKYVKDLCPLSPPKVHFYCKDCQFYVGEENTNCDLCGSKCNKFVQLSLADQLRNLFELHNLSDFMDKFNLSQQNNAVEGKYSNICDGTEFKRAWCGAQYDLVLHMYTDGVSLSESSEVQFYPLEFVICQLPFNLRFRFVLICGIWVDKSKPSMNTFLKPFVSELQELHENGGKVDPPSK